MTEKNKSIRCNIGNKIICANDIYYKCGSEFGCWGNYIVCKYCYEYGILLFMMDMCRTKKYNSLNKIEKYEVDKQIKKYKLQSPLAKYNKSKENKQKGIHIYKSYPNHYDENIHSPINDESDGSMSPSQVLINIANEFEEKKYNDKDMMIQVMIHRMILIQRVIMMMIVTVIVMVIVIVIVI